MAKKEKSAGGLGADVDNDDEKSGGFVGFLLAVLIIIIWLVIFALLIKMDVGGIGTMLRPVLKNVPVVSNILPEMSDEELMEETGYKYKSLAEAIERIKELEKEVAEYQNSGNTSSEQVQQLQAEVARLKVYEENQETFLKQKEDFDNQVVFAENAPDISEYKSWYDKYILIMLPRYTRKYARDFSSRSRFRTGQLPMLIWIQRTRHLLWRK